MLEGKLSFFCFGGKRKSQEGRGSGSRSSQTGDRGTSVR